MWPTRRNPSAARWDTTAHVLLLALICSNAFLSTRAVRVPQAADEAANAGCVSQFTAPQQAPSSMGALLESLGFSTGAEISAPNDHMTHMTLANWTTCSSYHVVPLRRSTAAAPAAAVAAGAAEAGRGAKGSPVSANASSYQGVLTETTEDAVMERAQQQPLDYLYLHLRNSFCESYLTLERWWPAVKLDGLLAGGNYQHAVGAAENCTDIGRPDLTGTGAAAAVNTFFKHQGLTVNVVYRHTLPTSWMVRKPSMPGAGPDCTWQHCGMYVQPVPTRGELASLLQQEGLQVGVELGVQKGEFAAHNLRVWTACKRYYLVDLWAPQANYKDLANVAQSQHNQFLEEAKTSLRPFTDKLVWLRNYTSEAVHSIKESLDFVYVDARHDYCGALEDIELYWPLLKPGGIMAGHDYENGPEVMARSNQDWGLCMNGTRVESAVQGAVNDFFAAQGLQVTVTWGEGKDGMWSTWLVRKPLAGANVTAAQQQQCSRPQASSPWVAARLALLAADAMASPSVSSLDPAGALMYMALGGLLASLMHCLLDGWRQRVLRASISCKEAPAAPLYKAA